MAITYFDYWGVGEAIKTTISSLSFRDGTPLLLHEERTLDSERVIRVSLADRGDQDFRMQPIAANQRGNLEASYAIDIIQSHVEETQAGRLRNRMLEEIEVGLLANPKLNVGSGDNVAQSFLGSVLLLDGENKGQVSGYWSACALRLICQKTITTQ